MRFVVFVLALAGSVACGWFGAVRKAESEGDLLVAQTLLFFADEYAQNADPDPYAGHRPLWRSRGLFYEAQAKTREKLARALLGVCPVAMLAGVLALARFRSAPALLLLLGANLLYYVGLRENRQDRSALLNVLACASPLVVGGLLAFGIRPVKSPSPPLPQGGEGEKDSPSPTTPLPQGERENASPTVAIPCPGCGKRLRMPVGQVPRQIRCPGCGVTFARPADIPAWPPIIPGPPHPEESSQPTRPATISRPWRAWKLRGAAGVLLVVGAAVFSALANADLFDLAQNPPDEPVLTLPELPIQVPHALRPEFYLARQYPDDPAPSATDEARFAAEREVRLKQARQRESALLAEFHTVESPPGAEALPTQRFRSEAAVNVLTLAPDGETLAGASFLVVRLWEVRTGKVRLVLTPHPQLVTDLAFSPDGQLLATACRDGLVRLWETRTGKLVRVCGGLVRSAETVTFTPSGNSVIAGGLDAQWRGEVRRWATHNAQPQGVLLGLEGRPRRLICSPRGLLAFAVEGSPRLVLFDMETQNVRRLIHCGSPVLDLAFSPDGLSLVVATRQGLLKRWSVLTGRPMQTYPDTGEGVRCLSFSPDGRWLAASVGAGPRLPVLQLWDAATGQKKVAFSGLLGGDGSLHFSPGGTFLVASRPAEPHLWAMEELLTPGWEALEAVRSFARVGRKAEGYHVEVGEEAEDHDLASLVNLPRLASLCLTDRPQFTAAGLERLAVLADLRALDLSGTAVTDALLDRLAGLKKLRSLKLERTRVSAAAVERLKKARPDLALTGP